MQKDNLYKAGLGLLETFCLSNEIEMPKVVRLNHLDRAYRISSCAFYRPFTISIMVEKCAHVGRAGRAWSWPGYAIDRTPYGVLAHELGHHVDTLRTGEVSRANIRERLFSRIIWEASKEPPLTGYLGTDKEEITFFMEWFAEMFRLYVTNPNLLMLLRPRTWEALRANGVKAVIGRPWQNVLEGFLAPERIIEQARKKTLGLSR